MPTRAAALILSFLSFFAFWKPSNQPTYIPETRTYEGEVQAGTDMPADKYGIWPTQDFETAPAPPWLRPRLLEGVMMFKGLRNINLLNDSVLVLYKGQLVYESYAEGWDKDTRHFMASVTKSVVSALAGIAIGEGYIRGLEQKVIDFFPEAVIAPGQESKRDMTVEHLLTMTSGLPDDRYATDYKWWEPGEADHFDTGLSSFQAPQVTKPGEAFAYNTGIGMQTLGCLVSRAVGRSLYDYAKEKLFDPLGMTSVTWDAVPADGSNYGGMGVHMTPRDMLRFGYLYLNYGRWEDAQILPAWWVAQSGPLGSARHSYGRLFWNFDLFPFDSSYEAEGAMGQYIMILPEYDTVAVRTGSAGPVIRALANTEGATLDFLIGLLPLKGLPVDYLKNEIFLRGPG